ncbi:MAG TPA: GntR family transcriptional regulator [Candidatus Sulfopaludibacter sp.]|jgi:GntR family transcriptional regulator|nr:GntR family transcriptional regulator [Candidatus Sulfopaludibacter sp.]
MRFKLEPASPIPMYQQLVEQVRRGIAAGVLCAEAELPSVRALAAEHLINPNTVARAYLELEREGLLCKRRGSGTYVAADAAALGEGYRVRIVRDLLDQALVAAAEFGLTVRQVHALVDERFSEAEEKSA